MSDRKNDARRDDGGEDSDEDLSFSEIDGGAANDDSDEGGHGHGRGRTITISVISVIVVAALAVGAWLLLRPSNNGDANDGERNRSSLGTSDTDSDGTATAKATLNLDFLKDQGVPDYYVESRNSMTDKQRQQADAAALSLAPSNTMSALPSKAANPNLTDDPSKAYLADKTMNPNYSFLTADNVSSQVRDDMERLVNPVYGDWTDLQNRGGVASAKTPAAGFADMFSADKSDAVRTADPGAARGLVPLFADWDSNGFGGKYNDKDPMAPAAGTIDSLSCDYNIHGTMDDSIACTAQVTYHIRTTAGAVKTEARTLKVNYRPDYGNADAGKNGARRILIDSIQQ